MSKQRSTVVLIVLLLLLLLGWWAIPTQSQYPAATPAVSATTAPLPAPQMSIQHSMHGQTHSYEGVLVLAPCESLASGVKITGGNPLQVHLSLTTTQASICNATTTAPGAFSISVTDTASSTPSLSVTVNTKPVVVLVIEK